jgi:8-oxo-dGTP diphosphatase
MPTTAPDQSGSPSLPIVLVAACALVDADGRVLLAQRPEGKSMAGLWEFPGGKVDPGETPEAALIRELHEELGIDTWRKLPRADSPSPPTAMTRIFTC